MGGSYLDMAAWPRRSHFEFYIGYENPFFSVTTDVVVTKAYECSRQRGGPSFFLLTLWCALRAASRVEPFRLRVRDGRVWRHDIVHAGSTVMRDDRTFAFSHFIYNEFYDEFEKNGRALIAKIKAAPPGLFPEDGDDEIYFSVLPWIRITGITNARPNNRDVIPRVVFGKVFEEGEGEMRMGVSVEVHHALVDGLHVGQFLAAFESELAMFATNHPPTAPAQPLPFD